MTLLNPRSAPDSPPIDIAWYCPENNLWVAAANGEHAGMIEFVDGHFSVRSSTGVVVAEASSIPAAQQALAQYLAEPSSALSRSFLNRVPQPVYLRDSLVA